jgi:ABC-type transport system involved in cytochrome bd biosynthesis fused ATPase/permease subunit
VRGNPAIAATTVPAGGDRLLRHDTPPRPQLLVLDEPTAGVDPQSRRTFWEALFEIAARETTVFVSTRPAGRACVRLRAF